MDNRSISHTRWKCHYHLAKSYLNDKEVSYMERIVSLYRDYAELQAERQIPMSMEDWAKRGWTAFWSLMGMKYSQMQERLVPSRQSSMQKRNLKNTVSTGQKVYVRL